MLAKQTAEVLCMKTKKKFGESPELTPLVVDDEMAGDMHTLVSVVVKAIKDLSHVKKQQAKSVESVAGLQQGQKQIGVLEKRIKSLQKGRKALDTDRQKLAEVKHELDTVTAGFAEMKARLEGGLQEELATLSAGLADTNSMMAEKLGICADQVR
jgi:hypothetical protein